jgi:hypothetical protein
MSIIKPVQPADHSPTWTWTIAAGDEAAILSLPLGARVLVQVDGELAGGTVDMIGGLLQQHVTVIKSFVSEGITTVPPVRFIYPEFTGAAAGATVTVIVSVAP